MCGRFSMAIEAEKLKSALALGQLPLEWPTSYNFAPSQLIPTVPDPETRDVVLMRWGLVPFWAKDPSIGARMINARAESVEEKPSFRNSFKHKRCLVLADGFYEWKKAGAGGKVSIPYYFSLKSGEPFAFAGLWDDWEPKGLSQIPGLTTCTIITTEANDVVAEVHPRMPVILEKEASFRWLESGDPAELKSLLRPLDPEKLQAWEVGRAVNSPANDGPGLIDPVKGLFG